MIFRCASLLFLLGRGVQGSLCCHLTSLRHQRQTFEYCSLGPALQAAERALSIECRDATPTSFEARALTTAA